jgi:hypothetical protein
VHRSTSIQNSSGFAGADVQEMAMKSRFLPGGPAQERDPGRIWAGQRSSMSMSSGDTSLEYGGDEPARILADVKHLIVAEQLLLLAQQ